MNNPNWLLSICLLTSAPLTASAVIIDFDDVKNPSGFVEVSGDFYAQLGLVFKSPFTLENVGVAEPGFEPAFVQGGGTSPNGVVLAIPFSADLDVEANFVVPGSSEAATVNSVSVHAFDDNVGTQLGILEAFDACGNLIESLSMDTPQARAGVYTIAAEGIVRIRLAQDADGGLFDNLEFPDPVAMPDPDEDSDGIIDALDNCVQTPNCAQRDTDGDGFGNFCDADLDGDCFVNFADLQILEQNFFSSDPDADFNGDGIVNFLDLEIMKSSFFGQPGPTSAPNSCVDHGN